MPCLIKLSSLEISTLCISRTYLKLIKLQMMDGSINDTSNQIYIILIQSFCKRSLNEDKISCENCPVVGTSSNQTGRYEFENQLHVYYFR